MNGKSFGLLSSLCAMLAGLVLLCFGLALPADNGLTFGGKRGRVTYAFGSASSNAVFVDKGDFADGTMFIGYKAVSVYYSGEGSDGLIEDIVKKFAAVEVYSEAADGVTCHYYYSEKIPVYKVLYIGKPSVCVAFGGETAVKPAANAANRLWECFGQRSAVKVNIHVAVSGCGVTVGSPMIYCGY